MLTYILVSLFVQDPVPLPRFGFNGVLPDYYPIVETARDWTPEERAIFLAGLSKDCACDATIGEQTTTATITFQPGEPFTPSWTYTPDPVRPVQFRLYLDGAILWNFKGSELAITGTGKLTYKANAGVLPAFTAGQRGNHTLAITAYDEDGESDRVVTVQSIRVGFAGPPAAPGDFKPKG